ncbi:MAG TPA: hypothetical protein VK889_00785 [Solirubrobacterales bacterium]|nr:hypothetical protein [Solirubrobacterales bacterium]
MRRPRIGGALVFLLALAAPSSVSATGPEGGLDSRAWEMVSPVEKNAGQVGTPQDAGAAAFQAAADGSSFAFGSGASFGGGAGAPPVSQYVATRGAAAWATANVSPPLLSGTYAGGAYQLFSADLSRALLSSGWRCRDGGGPCAAENPSLDAAAPAGYRTLYLRQGGVYQSLLTTGNAPPLPAAEDFQLSLAGATEDLSGAAIVADGDLFLWSGGTLTGVGPPGAALAAPAGAISADGSRVYFVHGGDLHLWEAGAVSQIDGGAGGGGIFQAASADGSVAFYLAAGHLYRYDALAATSQDLTAGGGAVGALGASASGSHLYYLTAAGLFLRQGAAVTPVAAAADASNLPAATGTARVSADGTRLAFVSSAALTPFPNAGKAEVYVYEAPAGRLLCVSCNPSGTPPLGPASIPPARAAAEGPPAYKPRALSADGTRLFFDSADKLVPQDTDGLLDVYEWEAAGSGGCAQPAGCLGLVSFGRSGADTFLDASADGRDAFFLTAASLVGADRGGLDVYDARAAGGFPEPSLPVVCEGDGCQGIVLPRDDPAPGTARAGGPPNRPPRYVEDPEPKKCKKGKVRKKGRCVKKPRKKRAKQTRAAKRRSGGSRR